MPLFDLKPDSSFKKRSRPIIQCRNCLKRGERGGWRKCPRCGSDDIDFNSVTNPTHIAIRKDLLMLTDDKYPDKFCPSTTTEEVLKELVASCGSAKLSIGRSPQNGAEDGHYAYLHEGDELWMTTCKRERLSMLLSVMYECPQSARVFIGGLGLGLVLLYLAASKRTTEVIVAETSKDIIRLMKPILHTWLSEHYPNFKWNIIRGDAFEEVKRHGKFDWIFFDVWKQTTLLADDPSIEKAYKASRNNLTEQGGFSNWIDAIKVYAL